MPPVIDYSVFNLDLEVILPELILLGFAILVIFVDLFMRGRTKEMVVLPAISINVSPAGTRPASARSRTARRGSVLATPRNAALKPSAYPGCPR